jgi:hypothetical protein
LIAFLDLSQVRKAILGEDDKTEIEHKIKEMTTDKKDKSKQLTELQDRFESLPSREEERWEAMKKKQHLEIRSASVPPSTLQPWSWTI